MAVMSLDELKARAEVMRASRLPAASTSLPNQVEDRHAVGACMRRVPLFSGNSGETNPTTIRRCRACPGI